MTRITAATCSNFDKFLPWQVHREMNVGHSLQSMHLIHAIFHSKINLNSKKNSKILHQRSYFFEKLCSNT
jgi:hypothetical protein